MNSKLKNNETVVNPPFYYGWIIVFVAGFSVFFSGPGQTFSISIFIEHYIADFEYSRSFVSGIYSTATLCAGFTLFLVGRLVDRYGQRKMMTIIGTLLAIACIWNAFLTGAVMMFIGIFMLRLFGQGSMTLLPNTLVPQWFMSKRGRALSIMTVGGFAGSALYPPMNAWLISEFGWRNTWLILAGLLLILFVPIAYLFVRNKPEDIGEKPDGNENKEVSKTREGNKWSFKDIIRLKIVWIALGFIAVIVTIWLFNNYHWTISLLVWAILLATIGLILLTSKLFSKRSRSVNAKKKKKVNPNVQGEEVNWTLKEAMRTKVFWFILFCVSVPSLVNTGVTFHIVSIAEGKGLTAATAALILSLMAIFGFPVSFVVGFIVDRISVHYVLAITFFGHLISLTILLMVNSVIAAVIFGVIWGVINGFERIALNIVWPNYFGRMNLGSIKGFAQTAMVLSSALGPLPFGLFYDLFDGYTEVIIVTMILPLTASILALFSPKPTYEAQAGSK